MILMIRIMIKTQVTLSYKHINTSISYIETPGPLKYIYTSIFSDRVSLGESPFEK